MVSESVAYGHTWPIASYGFANGNAPQMIASLCVPLKRLKSLPSQKDVFLINPGNSA